MNNNRGFTMIEIALVMVILGAMAALALVKYNKTVASNTLEKDANYLYSELRTLRSQAFKWDTLVTTKFYPDSISTWIDTNGINGCDANDIYKVARLTATVALGLPENPPLSSPHGDTLSSSGINGDWADSLTVFSGSRGGYSPGSITVFSNKLQRITYYIGNTSSQAVEFYKWDGAWYKL